MNASVMRAVGMPGSTTAGGQAVACELESVRFRYRSDGSSGEGWVLNQVSLQINTGEMVGIIGPNGSGKSSLLKVMARLVTPHDGRVHLFGQSLDRMSQEEVAREVGYVPQDAHMLFPFTVMETVLMGRFPHRSAGRWSAGFGWETPADFAMAEAAMATMDIAHLATRLVTELSGGERQRAVIARALTQAPRLLLLDEPTAFLDLQHQVGICSVLRRLNEEKGLTVILVSHDLNLASQYCDRLVLLKEGVVGCVGTPQQVIRSDVLRNVYACEVLVDDHPQTGLPRVTLPGRERHRQI